MESIHLNPWQWSGTPLHLVHNSPRLPPPLSINTQCPHFPCRCGFGGELLKQDLNKIQSHNSPNVQDIREKHLIYSKGGGNCYTSHHPQNGEGVEEHQSQHVHSSLWDNLGQQGGHTHDSAEKQQKGLTLELGRGLDARDIPSHPLPQCWGLWGQSLKAEHREMCTFALLPWPGAQASEQAGPGGTGLSGFIPSIPPAALRDLPVQESSLARTTAVTRLVRREGRRLGVRSSKPCTLPPCRKSWEAISGSHPPTTPATL